MLNTDPQGFLYRFIAFLAGLAMISLGVVPTVRHHQLFYANWFGELVFTPIAILFGIFTIGCALSKPSWLAAPRDERKRDRKHS
jgi:hypothetical protein